MSPLISVIIINHNGEKFLKRCLESLFKTDYENFEVIFVDNASSDESVRLVGKDFQSPRLRLVESKVNLGVPGGRNLGFKESGGEYAVFLDNDTEVDRAWLKGLLEAFMTDPKIAVAQAKLLNLVQRDRFDHAGDYLTPFGFLYERSSQARDKGQFDKVEDIFNAKGAATMVRSSIFRELGMYDGSYFFYLEETDFCLRAWLAGYRVVFAPGSVVWHAFNTPLKDTKAYYSNFIVRFYGCRNTITTLLKNLSFISLVKILPVHLLAWSLLAVFFFLKARFKDSWWIFKGMLWNLFNLASVFKRRAFVQKKIRKVSDAVIFKKVMIRQPIRFYLRKAGFYLRGEPFYETGLKIVS